MSSRLVDGHRGRTAASELARGLRDQAVRDLVDVGVRLLKMHTVRSSVGHVSEESTGQLALEVQVVLLQVAVLLHGVAGSREIVLGQNVLRHIRLGVAARHGRQVVSAGYGDSSRE